MPYKKKFKLPGLTWDTFIKFFFADIRKHIYKKKIFRSNKKNFNLLEPFWDTFIKKKFLETIKKISSKL